MNEKLDGIGFGENVVHEILHNPCEKEQIKNITKGDARQAVAVAWIRLEPVRASAYATSSARA